MALMGRRDLYIAPAARRTAHHHGAPCGLIRPRVIHPFFRIWTDRPSSPDPATARLLMASWAPRQPRLAWWTVIAASLAGHRGGRIGGALPAIKTKEACRHKENRRDRPPADLRCNLRMHRFLYVALGKRRIRLRPQPDWRAQLPATEGHLCAGAGGRHIIRTCRALATPPSRFSQRAVNRPRFCARRRPGIRQRRLGSGVVRSILERRGWRSCNNSNGVAEVMVINATRGGQPLLSLRMYGIKPCAPRAPTCRKCARDGRLCFEGRVIAGNTPVGMVHRRLPSAGWWSAMACRIEQNGRTSSRAAAAAFALGIVGAIVQVGLRCSPDRAPVQSCVNSGLRC